MKRKIILVGINARYSHSNLALRYMREVLRYSASDEFMLLEFSINQTLSDIVKNISMHKPDVVALSVYIWNSLLMKGLIPLVKKSFPECVIVAGGPEVTYNAENWLAELPELDYIIAGSGERGWKEFIDSEYIYNSSIIKLPNYHFKDIPFPYAEEDFKLLANRSWYYESSRGCFNRCSYCLSSTGDQKVEARTIEQVTEEIDFILKGEPCIIRFIDRTFNAQPRYLEIWEMLVAINTETSFHFEIHPGLLKEDDFNFLKNVPPNRFQFETGVQSCNQHVLDGVKRFANCDEVNENIRRLVRDFPQIPVHADLIAGLPLENKVSFINGFNLLHNIHPAELQLGFLKVLPGTPLAKEHSSSVKYSVEAPYAVISTDWLSADDVEELRDVEELFKKFYNYQWFPRLISELLLNFSDAYSCYHDMAVWIKKAGFELSKLDPGKMTEALTLYLKDKFIGYDYLFYFDLLRVDWLYCFKYGFPALLRLEEDSLNKKRFYHSLEQKELSSADRDNLKKGRWLFLYNKRCAEKYTNNANLLVFLPEGEILQFVIDLAE